MHLALLYAGIIASVFSARANDQDQVIIYLFLGLFCLYFIGITLGFIGQPRFRVPFVPFLSVLGATGIGVIMRAIGKPVS